MVPSVQADKGPAPFAAQNSCGWLGLDGVWCVFLCVLVARERLYASSKLHHTLLVPAAYFESPKMHKLAKNATYLSYGHTMNIT